MNLNCFNDSPDGEETAFYRELTKQILLLMDEDDETHDMRTRKGCSGIGKRAVSCGGSLNSGKYYGWLDGGRSLEVPIWMERLWANNVVGTGVFIPQVVAVGKRKPRRKRLHRPRKNKDGGRIHSSDG